jgi:ATP-dependent RNA helicase HelY
VLGTLELPEPFQPRNHDYQREVALSLREWRGDGTEQRVYDDGPGNPVALCPDLEDHLRWVRRARRAEADIERLRRRAERGGDDLVAAFSSVLRLLEDWGYLEGWELTERGARLRWVYNELDLLLTEAVELGHLSGLSIAQLAAVTSMFTYEARRADVEAGWPEAIVAARGEAITELWADLAAVEESSHLPVSRRPDPGFAAAVYAWAGGADLEDLFVDDDFAAGDFVRNCRQLLDLLRQLRDAFPELAETAAAAVRMIDRGIVAAGGRL